MRAEIDYWHLVIEITAAGLRVPAAELRATTFAVRFMKRQGFALLRPWPAEL